MTGASDLTYFLHIPKTAGTSVHSFLCSIAGTGAATAQLLWDDLMRTPEVLTERTRVVTGHFGGLFPLWIGEWPTMLTMLREPVARSVSHINHVQREPSHPLHERARDLGIVEYCTDPVLRTTVENFQSRYLASLSFARVLLRPGVEERPPDGMSVGFERALFSLDPAAGLEAAAVDALYAMDGVGVAEDLSSSLQIFAAVLRQPWRGQTPRLNAARDDQRSADELTTDERDALLGCTTIDRRVHAVAEQRVAELRRRYGIPTAMPEPA